MCRIALDAVKLARTQGCGVLLQRLRQPGARRHLLYGWTQLRDSRRTLGHRYLVGSGLEIGALNKPQVVSAGAHVTYLDHLDRAGLRAIYTDLGGRELVDVDIVDDGETLASVAAGSQDFIVANHYLEHCENLLGTMRSHLDRVKPGGLLFYTVPDRRMTFDWRRANTPFAHLVADDQGGAASARLEHYREWAQLVMGVEGNAIDKTAGRLMNRNESIHYHCWDKQSLRALFDAARSYLDDRFVILERHANGPEMVVVLRRIG